VFAELAEARGDALLSAIASPVPGLNATKLTINSKADEAFMPV
jgi:hypothetical protein